MEFANESKEDFLSSLTSIDTLVNLALKEDENDNIEGRALFLKLSVVFLVTRFQVFVESILKKLSEYITSNDFEYSNIPYHIKLNSLKLFARDFKLENSLDNHEAYCETKLATVNRNIKILHNHFDSLINKENFRIAHEFPLGKTGTNRLIQLFQQFEGINIFEMNDIEIDILNSILEKRHLIVHKDRDLRLSETQVREYKTYMTNLSDEIESYVIKIIQKIKPISPPAEA